MKLGGLRWELIVIFAFLAVSSLVPFTLAEEPPQSITPKMNELREWPRQSGTLKTPSLDVPEWLVQQKTAEDARNAQSSKPRSNGAGIVVTYDVMTKGNIVADVNEFKAQVSETLNDGKGWSRMSISFKEVASSGMFTLVLSEANQLPTFSSGCGVTYSCRAGRYVIINQDRWLGGTSSWNEAGGSLRDYRHMVVNHETGHWLGHDHQSCGGVGQKAPVMQQQSISLQGCSFNPWPLDSELWSTQLGIG